MSWKKLLSGDWNRIDDEMLQEELNEMLAKIGKIVAKEVVKEVPEVKFAQIPGAPPVRALRKK